MSTIAAVPQTARRPAAPSRWIGWVTWVAILAPLPYSLSRVLWAAGVPIGVDASFLHDDLGAPGLGSLYLLALALLSEATGLFTHVFVHRRARRVPARVPWLGGRRVRPRTVVGVLCAPLAILWIANAQSIWLALDGIPADDLAHVPAWSTWTMVAVFWVWSLALTVATVN